MCASYLHKCLFFSVYRYVTVIFSQCTHHVLASLGSFLRKIVRCVCVHACI